jgi:antitoxin (DNA-binding transcriptional repressor) of toxin-antitoxin stability system
MKKRTTVSATDLRVNLGAMLRRLEAEDLVVEKGGVPVAVLSRYAPVSGPQVADERSLRRVGPPPGWREVVVDSEVGFEEPLMTEEELLAEIATIRARGAARRKAAAPVDDAARDATWEDSMAAIREGWSIDGEELKANIRRWRDEGSRLNRYYTFTEDGVITEVGDERTEQLSDRQRRLHRHDQPARHVADRGDTTYEA